MARRGRDSLFSGDNPGQNPVLAFSGLFQHLLVNALFLARRRIADEIRERSRGDRLGFAIEEHRYKIGQGERHKFIVGQGHA